jgi:hypothetical protein
MGKEKEWRPLAQSHKHGPRFHDHDCFGWNRMKNRATHLASYQPIWTRPQQPQAVFFERRLSVITRASDHQKSRAPLAPVENQRTICIPKPQASLRWSYHLPMMPNSNPSRNAKSLSNVRVCQPFSIKNHPLVSTKTNKDGHPADNLVGLIAIGLCGFGHTRPKFPQGRDLYAEINSSERICRAGR